MKLNMKRKTRSLLARGIAIGLGLASSSAPAAEPEAGVDKALPVEAARSLEPDLLVKDVGSEVLAILKRDFDAGNPSKVAELVEAKILPYFDFAQMTRSAMALNWRAASPAQQAALVEQFKTLLVRTYSSSLATYRDRVIDYKPLRARPGETDVTVRSIVLRPGTEPLQIDYDMEKTDAGWKVYDVKVAGVSMVITYRASFAAEVRERGVDGLIKLLSEKNLQVGSARLK